jgi:hypothetical protein
MVKIEVDLLQNEIETYIQCRDSCIACRYYDDFQIKSNFLLLLIYQKKIFGSRTGIYLPRVFVPAFFCLHLLYSSHLLYFIPVNPSLNLEHSYSSRSRITFLTLR